MLDTMDKSDRIKDTNGFFEVKKNPLSLVGVFPYTGAMIGAEDKERIYNVYRPSEELGSDGCIDSFKLLPFVDDHTMLGDGATPAEQKGVHGIIGQDVIFEDGVLYGNIKVFSESLANLITSGKKELSCGYRCEYEFATGEHNGVQYEAIQRNIRGNHLALVAEGRMGKEVSVLDSMVFTFDAKELIMPEEIKAEDAEVTLESLAAQVAELMSFMQNLKPKEEEEHGSLDEEVKAEDEEVKAEDAEIEAKDEDVKKEGMDMALVKKEIFKEIAQRDNLYTKVSNVVGSFDHSEMSLKQVASYGVKKLNLSCTDGAEIATINGYLAGIAKASNVVVMDSKASSDEISKYLNGGN